MRLTSLAFAMLALPAAALADPTGKFDARGVNPDTNEEYTGTVSVTRTGETYKVVWQIGGQQLDGIGVGVRLVGGIPVLGPAGPDDTGISIAYGSGDSYGTVIYFEQPDGTWHGTWAYTGTNRISTEDWTPKGPRVVKSDDIRKVEDNDPTVREVKPDKAAQPISTPLPALASPKS